MEARTKRLPIKMALVDTVLYVMCQGENVIQEFSDSRKEYAFPLFGRPNNIELIDDKLVITSHSENLFLVYYFDINTKNIKLIFTDDYPYGDTSYDHNNTAFYLRGQWGDSVFEITKIVADEKGRVLITDYLSGKLFIIEKTI
jgi:hypothetical protein